MLAKKFEDQVKETPAAPAVKTAEKTYTYEELNRYANRIAHQILKVSTAAAGETVGLLFEHGVHMIAAILGALKAGKIYVPLSVDYPVNRLSYMLADSGASLLVTDTNHAPFARSLTQPLGIPVVDIHGQAAGADEEDNPAREIRQEQIAYILYTSGSTGRPKGVVQTHQNADYYNRNWVRAFSISASDRMTLFSSFCHDGSVQDMYSALHSGACLYPLDMKNRQSTDELSGFLMEEGITIWHSVPSLFAFFANTLSGSETFPVLRFILLGGEPVRRHEVDLFKKHFPHSMLANVYGQTESSVNAICLIKQDQRYKKPNIGTPLEETEIFVIDDEGELVRTLEAGEILVACKHLSPGYWKNPEATENAFGHDDELGRLYWTGDLGRLLVDGSIEFLGRRDHQVKIRGFRVEPGEIETQLLKHDHIKEAVVTAREDENGDTYLTAYIVTKPGDEKETEISLLRSYLAEELPDYMVPGFFVFLDKMPLTPNGKIDRKALPAPAVLEPGQDFTAPRDEVEKKLAAIWAGVLDIKEEDISIDADFFQVGGHSLKANIMGTRIHKAFNVPVPLRQIFKSPSIRQLAGYVKAAQKEQMEQYEAIEPAERKEFYALTPMQQRFYMIQVLNPRSTAFNMPQLVRLVEAVDKEKIEQAFNRLIQRHESLRTSIAIIDDQPVQLIHEKVQFRIDDYEYDGSDDSLWTIRRNFIRPFDLSKTPLLRVGLVKSPGSKDSPLLLVDTHHIISDGTSRQVLSRDFLSLYAGEELPSLKLCYRDFSQWLNRILHSEAMKRQEEYWFNKMKGDLPVLDLPTDYPRPETRNLEGACYTVTLGTGLTGEVNRLIRQTGTTLYMVLLAAFNTLLYRYSGQQDILVGTPTAGRYHADLENIIGLVIGGILTRNFPNPNKTFKEFLEEIKTNTLEAFEHQAYPLEELLRKINWQEKPGHNHAADVALVVQNMDIYDASSLVQPAENPAKGAHRPAASKLDVTIYVMEKEGDITLIFEYSTALFKPVTIERMANHLISILQEVIKNPGVALSAVDMISAGEKIHLLGHAPVFYPLTHPQKRIYYTEKIYPGTSCTNAPFVVRYKGILDKQLLEQAINIVLRKNDGLRLRILEFQYLSEPLQYIAPHTHYSLETAAFTKTVKNGSEEQSDREQQLKQWAEQETLKPLPMIDSPLYYFNYLKFNENESGFYMKFHHIITDGFGVILTLDEITSVYRALKAGEALDESFNPSYVEYIPGEKKYLRSRQAEQDRRSWLEYLLPLPEKNRLTGHGVEAPLKTPTVQGKLLVFPSDLRRKIHRYRENHKTSLFKLILSALAIYVSRASGSDDTVIATTNHNRTTEPHREMSGMFVSTFPIRVRTRETMTFRRLVEKNSSDVNYILKNHQRYPFDLLLEELREITGIDPIYLLDINLIGHPDRKESDYMARRLFPAHDPSPLTIHINHANRDIRGVLELQWHYQPHLFSGEEIEQIHRCLITILDDALTQPEKLISEIELLSEKEKEMILHDFNATAAAERYGQDKPVHQLFEEKVETVPDRAAVVSGNRHLSYRELNREANQLAHGLRKQGVTTDTIVGICIEPSLEMAIGLWAVLKAGGAYLPIDPGYPRDRINYMLSDSGACILLTHKDIVPSSSTSTLTSTCQVSPANLAYIIYTSGSTGRPKGVLVEHGNLAAYLDAFENEFHLSADDIVIQQASFVFDAFVEEFYPILLKGGKLAVPQRREVKDVELLVNYISRYNITMITCSPLLLNELNRRRLGGTIRIFISGGDQLNAGYIDHLVQSGPGKTVVYNTYGPTESTVCASYYRCQPGDPVNVPIGKPIVNYNLYIVDRFGHLLPVGVPGELSIAGPGVTRGYLNQPELTVERFVPVFYRSYRSYKTYIPGRLYKTGDLARWLPGGNIEFLGRIDHQVKIRGFRIELREIEQQLQKHKSIKEAVVVVKNLPGAKDNKDQYLCAYFVAGEKSSGSLPAELKDYLSRALPGYMVPLHFIELETIPLTLSGKVDKRALPEPGIKTGKNYAPPRDKIEKKLAEIWRDILGMDALQTSIGIDDNFFALRGHSLKAALLTSKMYEAFNVHVPLTRVFETPSIRELAQYVKTGKKVDYSSIKAVEKKEYYRQSSAQKRLFFLDQFENVGTNYNISFALELRGKIDNESYKNAFTGLIHRHESLRTSFHTIAGEPVQKVHEPGDIEFEVECYDLGAARGQVPLSEPVPGVTHIINNFVRSFDLSRAPLLRVGLAEPAADRHILLVDMHHIVSDGTSMGILTEDFIRLTNGEKLTQMEIQYKEFALWQKRLVERGELEKQEQYWLGLFPGPGEIPVLSMPTDFPRPAVFSFEGSRYGFKLDTAAVKGFKELSSRSGATLYMVLLAAFNILLHKYTAREDFVVGSAVSGRTHADFQPIIGMFVNTLPMRNQPGSRKTCLEFIKEVKENSIQAFENQDVQFEDLVERINPPRDTSRNPLFDVTFVVQNFERSRQELKSVTFKPISMENKTAKFDLTLLAFVDEKEWKTNKAKEIQFLMEYCTALFKAETIRGMAEHFLTVIRQMAENPELRIHEIDLVTEREKQHLLFDFNDTTVDYPRNKTIHRLFAEQAGRTPDNTALVAPLPVKYRTYRTYETYISHQELNNKSNQLAMLLQEKGAAPDTIVAIMLERSIDMIVAILGTLKAGAAYLPIDPDYPQERIDYMLKDSKPLVLLTAPFIADTINRSYKTHMSYLSATGRRPSPASLAYIIYTSGTTGKPKGTLIEHKNVVRLLFNDKFTNLFTFNHHDTWTLFHSFCFDFSVWEMYGALLYGGKLIIVSKTAARDTEKFLDILETEKVTVLNQTPSAFYNLIAMAGEERKLYIRYIVFGGEALNPLRLEKWAKKYPHTKLINMYGITETTVHVTYKEITGTDVQLDISNIGKPIPTLSTYVMDRNLRILPLGVPGELCVGGEGVARGYLNRPGLTAEKFVDNPYLTGEILYRSGDLVKLLAGGDMEYLGRIDHQVKIRGYRVELGEIESCLLKHRNIEAVVVVVREEKKDKYEDRYICAYIVPRSNIPINIVEIKDYLSRRLPDYMIPVYFIEMERIPLTPNGKVDRKALPEPKKETFDAVYKAPRNKREDTLAAVWAGILNIRKETIGIDNNFFELGGHSLNATLLISRIHKELKVKIPLIEIFQRQTIRGLSEYIKHAQEEKYEGIKAAEKKEYYSLSSAQSRLYFLQRMDMESTAYHIHRVIPLGKNIQKNKLESALKKLVARHESLRTSFILANEVPVQKIHNTVGFEIEYYKGQVEAKVAGESTHHLARFIRPFDLAKAPLIRSALIKLHDGNHIWMVDVHHIVSDGTSVTILSQDFTTLYRGEQLEPLRLHYKDFSIWQNRLFTGGEIKTQEDYWLHLYADEIPVLQIPADYKRPEVFTFAGSNCTFLLEPQVGEKFKALGSRNGATLYMNILAVLNTLFYKYTGQKDIVIGSGIAGRPHADLQHIIGMFVNMLAMRNYPGGEQPYETFLKEVSARSVEAFENQDVQFEDLVDKLEIERDPSRNPLFDVSMVVQNFKQVEERHMDLDTDGDSDIKKFYRNRTSKFDLTFFTWEEEDNIYFNIEYYTGIFKDETISRLVNHFKNIFNAVVNDPCLRLKDIEIISPGEKEEVLYKFNDTANEYPEDKTIHELFAEQVEKTPDRVALVGGGALTYRQLNADANRTASYLSHEKGINPGDTVGILMSQSLYRPIAILGALEAGAGYVPMDPSLPHDRLKYMIKDACTGTIISEKQYIKDLNRLQWECRGFHSYLCMDSYDVHGEEEAERNELMNEDLWLHVGETAVDDISGGGWVSSYTGEPLSREEMDEYGDNVLKKLQPLLHKEMRVLEIGAASGITMFRLAPEVGLYYGTDLSQVIIDKNKERVRQQGYQNIKLSCLPAHEIDKIEENNFDLIIINSVIQCFHGHNYLRKVFRKSIDLLGEKGYLFIGDIMDQEKKDALVKELTAFKKANRTKNYTTKTDFSSELFIARGFWRDLAEEYPGIEAVEFSDKIYAIPNELTEFRYDTFITINKQSSANKSKPNSREREKYQDDLSILAAMAPGLFHLSKRTPSTGPAYIIYTSGTAGIPKGVMITHRSLVNLCWWHNRDFMVTGFDHATLYAGFGFDASVWELFPYLIKGSAIHIIEDWIRLDMDKLQEYYRRYHITIAFLPTQFCRHFLPQASGLPALRVLLTGGDKLHADEHIAAKRNYHLYNNYGPTENTVVTTSYKIETLMDNIPIGSPIDNTCVYILDKESLQPQPVGVPGELCIAGDGLAPGYLNNPELTAEKFDHDLWDLQDYHDRYHRSHRSYRSYKSYLSYTYRTGDLARWLPDGTIEFQGRIDQQVKVRGFRIELGEIETCLLKHEAINEAVVIQRDDEEGDRYLCAYICIGGIAPVDAAELESGLKEYLAKSLPAYMIPAYFVSLDKIPLTVNGKIDRKKLPEPGLTVGERRAYKAPATETEKRLVELWSEVLGIGKEKIGVNDDFFRLGGHSLKATVLTAKIHKVFDIKIPLLEIFKTPTIEHLARYIRDAKPELYISVKAVEKREYYPVSSAQKRLYVLHQLEGGNMAYNMPTAAILEGDLDQGKLEKVFRQFIHRHETLRTSFHMVNEEVVQVVHEENYKIQITKYKQIPNHKLQNTNTAPFIRPFDLSTAPLIRIGLTALAGHRHVFMMDLHHIVSDGVSQGLSFREFMALYNDEKLPPLRIQYKDYAVWQQSEEERKRIAKQREYWLTEFAGEIPVLNLPLDFARPTVQSFDGRQVSTQLDAALTDGIKQMAFANDATLFMVLLSFYTLLLAKLSGQEDIVVGTPAAGRDHADLQPIIGMFVNTLALRNQPSGEKRFTDFLKQLKERTLTAFQNQECLFEDLVEQVEVTRDTGRNPLFDVMFSLLNLDIPGIHLPGLNLKPYPLELNISKFDMMLYCSEGSERLHLTFEYCTRLFKEETIERFIRYFNTLVSAVLDNPRRKIKDIEIISLEERKQVLYDFNDTAVDYPRDKTIHGLFEEQVERTADNIAVLGNHEGHEGREGFISITYRELNEKSNQLAGLLKENGVEPGDLVAIIARRSLEMMIGIFAILKAGAAYLPVSPDYPPERIDYILADSGVGALLTTSGLSNEMKCEIVRFSDAINRVPTPDYLRHANTLAYIIYTSGSTGKPKGVMVEHHSVINRLHWMQRAYPLTETDRILQKTPVVFDVSVWELFWWSFQGASLCLLAPGEEKSPEAIVKAVREHCISTLHFVPSMLAVFLDYIEDAGRVDTHDLRSIRQVFASGEALGAHQVKSFNRLLYTGNKSRLINLYGPTEATVDVSFFNCDLSDQQTPERIPIGKPIDNIQLAILDRYLKLQPPGITGELCIAGVGLARGYLNRPELTVERFCFDLYRSYKSYRTYIYKTGDLGRWLPDGNIEYLGRMDFQVKIRGFRIEPGEIENQLLKNPGIKETVVIAGTDRQGDRYLCAYIVPQGSALVDSSKITELREFLAQNLPDYMIPAYFVSLESIPLTSNGKIDRKSLPEPRVSKGEDHVAPRTPGEKKLAEIWADLLDIEQENIGIDDGFFRLGGQSLKATLLTARVHNAFQVKLTLADIFNHTSIRQLARLIEDKNREKYRSIQPVEKKSYYAVSSAQKRLYIVQQLDLNNLDYNMNWMFILEGNLDVGRLEQAFNRVIQRHEVLRTGITMRGIWPVQVIHPRAALEIDYIERIKEEGEEMPGPREMIRMARDFVHPFDLSKPPSMRVRLVKVKERVHILIMDLHHIATDAVSNQVIIGEVMDIYSDREPAPVRLHYKDFSQWQNKFIADGQMKNQEEYWLRKFAGDIPRLNLPLDFPRPALHDGRCGSVNFDINPGLTGRIKELTLETGTTFYMVLLAVYNILLSRYSGQEDIIVGSAVGGRRHTDLEKVVGMFVNMLALRSQPLEELTVMEFLNQVKTNTLDAYENQDYPFDELVRKLGLEALAGRNPLFDVEFNFHNVAPATKREKPVQSPEIALKYFGYDHETLSFDLGLIAVEGHDSIHITLGYLTALFKKSTIENMGKYFMEILEQCLEDRNTMIKDIDTSFQLAAGAAELTKEEVMNFDF